VGTILRSRRAAPVAAVALGIFTAGLGIASVPMGLLAGQPADVVILQAVGLMPFAAVAAVLAARRSRNPIGWLLLGLSLAYAVSAVQMYHGTRSLGWGVVESDWPVELVLIAIIIWLFPDGLPRGRWRRASVVLLTAGGLLGLVAWAGNVIAVAEHRYQLGTSAGTLVQVHPDGATRIPAVLTLFAVAASLLVWLAVLVPRYRHSATERRLQLKWLYAGAVIAVAGLVAGTPASGSGSAFWHAVSVSTLLVPAAIAVCFGVAVMKYRLYEIDRIISRVISYAVVTGVLAGVFAGVVVLAAQVLPFKEPVAVAASTLAAAALFNPLRTRVQHVVDRRFNRARHNAEAVVAAFTARMRGTVDLDTVQGDLVNAVHQAFEPAHVSVWLMSAGQHRPASPGAPSLHGST
jgi:hypothetical protein